MKKYFVSFVFLVLFGGYTAFQYLNNTSAANATLANSQPAQTDTQLQTQPQPSVSQPVAVAANDTVANTNEQASQQTTETQTQSPTPQQTQPTPAQPTPVQTPIAKPKGEYTDGTYTGGVADAFYGYIQVQATISGGKLAGVTFLQYPNDRSQSRFINQQAMPILTQEAIQAQSANVNGVSGASDTSAAFVESLGSALAQAKA